MTTPNVSERVRRAWATEVQMAPIELPEGERASRPWIQAGNEAWARRTIYNAR